MITVDDCAAFCDADPDCVRALACREGLAMVSAYARAHELALCAEEAALAAQQEGSRSKNNPGRAAVA